MDSLHKSKWQKHSEQEDKEADIFALSLCFCTLIGTCGVLSTQIPDGIISDVPAQPKMIQKGHNEAQLKDAQIKENIQRQNGK